MPDSNNINHDSDNENFITNIDIDVNSQRFKKFPSTIYMARKLLEVRKKSKTYA
ncbi:2790_t:CDS:2, partial [Funneliformis caledonium]